MSIAQAIVLGVVQGLSEFLPISSSAHLILVPWLFGWQDPGLAFDVALHWGTLVAVLVVFWRDWIKLIRAGVASLLELLIAGTMSVMAVVLWITDRYGRKARTEGDMRMPEAVGIGVAQAFALVPGVSRSGSTISVGLAYGFTREAIARFSFLMSTPIIFGAGVLKFPKMLREMHAGASHIGPAELIAGLVASAVVGVIVIRWLLAWLRTRTYDVFVVYRLLVAVLIVVLWLSGRR